MAKIGDYTLHPIETGTFGLDGGAMFGVVPKPLWERRMVPDERNRIKLSMRCLLIEGGGKLILVDNGLGNKYDPKFAGLYNVDHSSDTLDASLASAGFSRTDITDVILTHLHFDHAGGSTEEVDGKLHVAFENARFHVQRDHWVAANAPNARERASFFRENLEPLAASGQLNLLHGQQDIFKGISVDTFFGHTESMQTVSISDPDSEDEKTLVFVADLLPTSHHLAPAWTMGYDIRPLKTMDEKDAFLKRAIEADWDLFFEHDPDVEIARVILDERGRPVVAQARPLKEL
ncbi:MAG: MBL fold metallo-hydrolase [Rhodothermales bacterium]|nr:MBL fold metallo-hydrolase [Rhodothermales bacterium]